MTVPAVEVAAFGSWTSPITARDVAAGSHPVGGGRFVGDEVWWSELRPAEGGRYAVRRRDADGTVRDLLPAPWNARTRVHEYGGGAWTVTAGGDLVFAEFADQRLYALTPGGEPSPLTPAPAEPAGLRYAELQLVGDEVWCVRETHDGAAVRRDLAAVPLDGSAADDTSRVRSVVGGSHFLAGARLSPDGGTLAWIAWEHPQMPWDGTELRVAPVQPDGTCGPARTLIGSGGENSPPESVLQPEWTPDGRLYALADRTGFWNLYEVPLDGGEPRNLHPVQAEVGGPLWTLGTRWYALQGDGTVLAVRTSGVDTLCVIDPADGSARDVDLPGVSSIGLNQVEGRRVLLTTGGSRVPGGLRLLELGSGAVTDVRLGVDDLPDPAWFAEARPMSFTGPGGRDVHAVVYPPTNRISPRRRASWPLRGLGARRADRQRHPRDVGHRRPTSPAAGSASSTSTTAAPPGTAGSTASGCAVSGAWSTSRTRWPRCAVWPPPAWPTRPGSPSRAVRPAAGRCSRRSPGPTSFACGVSYFGVAELLKFAEETHDFESRYLDGLIGPLPEARRAVRDRHR